MSANLKKYTSRFLVVFVIALLLVFAINEGAFHLIRDEADRAPQTVELVIPAGTAESIARGEETPSIPDEMVFVVGDTLLIANQDDSDHQLGPVWVPPGSRASLVLDEVNNFAYSCSFQPSRYLGLDVRSGTTIWSRVTALLLAGPPTAMFLFIYSLLVFPLDKKTNTLPNAKPIQDL
jgi:hypothetical protein